MNVYEAIIPKNAPRQKLESYLAHAFPLLPGHVIRNALSKKDVKLDVCGPEKMPGPSPAAGLCCTLHFPFPCPLYMRMSMC